MEQREAVKETLNLDGMTGKHRDRRIDDNTFIADGNVYLDDLEEETGVELESETSETIGGFIIDLMGEIPKENFQYSPISYEDYDFTIMSVKDRRIEKVRINIRNTEEESDE
jgi:putative hemolysin